MMFRCVHHAMWVEVRTQLPDFQESVIFFCNGLQGSNLVVRLGLQKNLATELSLWPHLQLLMQNNMSW